jgi:hypothetical protein
MRYNDPYFGIIPSNSRPDVNGDCIDDTKIVYNIVSVTVKKLKMLFFEEPKNET